VQLYYNCAFQSNYFRRFEKLVSPMQNEGKGKGDSDAPPTPLSLSPSPGGGRGLEKERGVERER
jgi:hypothetical protein